MAKFFEGTAKALTISPEITRQSYFPALDGLRGVAIGLILLHHCFGKLFAFCWIGVDLFFVLSGFLITRILLESLEKKNYLLNFFGRRVLRIFPLYYFVLAVVFFLFPLLINDAEKTFSYLFEHQAWFWTYTENWLINRDGWAPGQNIILSHFWSLAIEEQYYLLWPFVVLLFRGRALLIAIFCLIATAVVIRTAGILHNPGYYVATITRMDSLLMGALLAALLYRFRNLVNNWSKALFVLSGIAILAGLLITRNPDYSNRFFVTAGYTLLAVFFAAVIAIVIEEKNNLLKRSLNNRPLIFLGKYSYGLYVFHFPVFWLLRAPVLELISGWIASPDIAKLATSLVCLAITIACALLSFSLIEKPFLRLKAYFGNRASVPKAKVE